MTDDKLILKLIKLTCYLTDESDADEVYLKVNNNKIWPLDKAYESITEGEYIMDFNLKDIPSGSWVKIELWDKDVLSSNDLLGSFDLFIDKVSGPFDTDMQINTKKTDIARYNITWKIIKVE